MRTGTSPSTAKSYKSALRVLFQRTNGTAPDPATVGDLLASVAMELSYTAQVVAAWRALMRAAAPC